MSSELDAINLTNLSLLLLMSFCVALIIVGVLIMKTKLWRTKSGAHLLVGRMMVICGGIISFVSLLFFLVNLTKLK